MDQWTRENYHILLPHTSDERTWPLQWGHCVREGAAPDDLHRAAAERQQTEHPGSVGKQRDTGHGRVWIRAWKCEAVAPPSPAPNPLTSSLSTKNCSAVICPSSCSSSTRIWAASKALRPIILACIVHADRGGGVVAASGQRPGP